MTIDTGCSTTLTAFHQACQTLRSGESEMSIVSASNVILNPDNFMVMSSTYDSCSVAGAESS
jgi:acyl transferase domain-containing protein